MTYMTKSRIYGRILTFSHQEQSFLCSIINIGSYMSSHALLNLSNGLGKSDTFEAYQAFYRFSQHI